jgi:hypothetical protein
MPKTSTELNNLETLIVSLNLSLQTAFSEIERLKNYIQKLDETYILIEKNPSGEYRIRYWKKNSFLFLCYNKNDLVLRK